MICIRKYNDNISIVADLDTKEVGYVKANYEIYDTIPINEIIYELTDNMTDELMKEGVIHAEI